MNRIMLVSLVLSLAIGCNGNPGPKPQAIELGGIVKLADGRPAAFVLCNFRPRTATQLPAEYPTDGNGQLTAGNNPKIALIPGKYRVFISELSARTPADRTAFARAFQQIPGKFTNEAEPAVEVTVSSPTPLEILLDG